MNDAIQLEIRGEIISAINFEGKSLFVSYCFLIPEGWICKNEDHYLSGNTICSQVREKKIGERSVGIAVFNQLFELSITLPKLLKETGSVKLVVEVTSFDWWERFRSEGYGMINFPLIPGRNYLILPTWRPLPSPMSSHAARLAEMRRYFVGGSPQLRDMGCSLADTNGKSILSRAGLCAESAGELQISLDVGLQTGVPKSGQSGHTYQHQFQPSTALVSSVDQVISAFLKVQTRMAKVRETMRANFNVDNN